MTKPRPLCFARLTYDIEILLRPRPIRPFGGWQPFRLDVRTRMSARHDGGPAARLRHHPDMFQRSSCRRHQRVTLRKRSALPMTQTELMLIAALAIIGFRIKTKSGIEDAGGDRYRDRVEHEREEQVLPDVAHCRSAQPPRPHDPQQVASDQRNVGTF